MSATLLRQPPSAAVSTSSAASSSQAAGMSSSVADMQYLSSLPPPPSYSYSIGAVPYQSSGSMSSELPTSYAPNPNVRLDFAFHRPEAAVAAQLPASPTAVSSALPTSYAPSVSPALVASVAPSVRIYPAFNAMYKPSAHEQQQMAAPTAATVVSYAQQQSVPPQLAHAVSVPVHISYPNVGPSGQPVHSTYSYAPASSHMYPHVVSPAAPPVAAAFSAPVPSSIHRAVSLPSIASSPALPAAEMSANESVHLANFQARVAEERWLMNEQKDAERRRKQMDVDRERERIRRERNSSVSASFHQAFGGLFSPLRKKGSSGSSPSPSNSNKGQNRLIDSMKGLSLDSKPPSKVVSDPPAAQCSPLHHKHLLTDQFIRNEADPSQKMVRHLVVPTDDLVDLALRYDTTVEAIRRHNRRVVFQHLDNIMNEYIHIPVSQSFQLPVVPVALVAAMAVAEDEKRNEDYVVPGAGGLTAEELRVQSEMNRQFYAVRSFLSQVARRRTAVAGTGRAFIGEDGEAVADCTEQEAEFYLQESNFNVNLALAAYMEDLEWEARDRDDKKRRQQATAAVRSPAGSGNAAAAGRSAKSAKPASSLALALAEARQQRLSAIARDASAAQKRDAWMARKLKKSYNMRQHGQMAAPLLHDADAEPSQQSAQDGGAALSEENRAEYEQSLSSGPAFSYYNAPSVAS